MAKRNEKVKASGGGLGGQGEYPFQFIAILIVFVLFIAGYMYFTAGNDESTQESMNEPAMEQSTESG